MVIESKSTVVLAIPGQQSAGVEVLVRGAHPNTRDRRWCDGFKGDNAEAWRGHRLCAAGGARCIPSSALDLNVGPEGPTVKGVQLCKYFTKNNL